MAKIVFLNQGGGLLFRELVYAAGEQFASVVYCTHEALETRSTALTVRRTPRYDNRSVWQRLASWFAYLGITGLWGLTEDKRALLFIVTDPPLAPLIGVVAHWLRRQRYVLLFFDLYPEAIERFGGGLPRPAAALWRWMNRTAMRSAAAVVTISPQLALTLAQYGPPGAGQPRVTIIPTWVDTDFIRPIDKAKNRFAEKYDQLDKLTVLYAGNMGNVHDLTMIPELAQRLSATPQVQFLLVGDGAKREWLQEECERRGVSNVTFVPFQPEAALPEVLACGEVAVVTLAAGAEGVSMPSKSYYAMAAGSALLAISARGSDLDRLVIESGCGASIAPGDVDAAVDAILAYFERPELLAEQRRCARQAAETKYSRAVCVPQMLDVIRGALT